MTEGKAYTLSMRRKREGKTNYKARLKLLVSKKARVVLRRRLNNFSIQIVNFDPKGDKVVVSSYSKELSKYGWKGHCGNFPSAYLVGFLCGLKAKKQKITSGVADLGLFRVVKTSNLFAALKGLKDSGFDIVVSDKMLPTDERVSGKHIEDYAKLLKGKDDYNKRFSKYIKEGLNPEEFSKHFEEVKKKIIEKW